jgi:cysteate synthase
MKAPDKKQAPAPTRGVRRAAAATHYQLRCPVCGAQLEDSPGDFLLSCPERHAPALLRAVYQEKRFVVHAERTGVFRYSDWLPVRRLLPGAFGPAAYWSKGLARLLGLEKLLVIFNGWWPEKGALMETCTFKELEAQAVCGRVVEDWTASLVVSSAGNTARAFHHACARYWVPTLIVVPGASLPMLWRTGGPSASVRLAVLEGGADYADAIALGNDIAKTRGFYSEGGARNAARRDGMGTALLSAVEQAQRIPDHYFQAVGSGTGAIAAWEMSLRLLEDGRFGDRRMRLHLSQNAPFTPIADAWDAGTRLIAEPPAAEARARARAIHAQVLANRNPPYSLVGGLYDALLDTRGHVYRVTDAQAQSAGRLFELHEGIDIDPAAEVAVGSLLQAVSLGRVGARDLVALNVTGGGTRGLRAAKRTEALTPDAVFTMEQLENGGPGQGLEQLREALV